MYIKGKQYGVEFCHDVKVFTEDQLSIESTTDMRVLSNQLVLLKNSVAILVGRMADRGMLTAEDICDITGYNGQIFGLSVADDE